MGQNPLGSLREGENMLEAIQSLAQSPTQSPAQSKAAEKEAPPKFIDIQELVRRLSKGTEESAENYQYWSRIADVAVKSLDYESAIALMSSLRERTDMEAFVVGDLARATVGPLDWGKQTEALKTLARETGFSYYQLRERMDTASFFPPHIRMAIMPDPSETTLTWSHFNRARRGKDLEGAKELLEMASEESWSVAQMIALPAREPEGAAELGDASQYASNPGERYLRRGIKMIHGGLTEIQNGLIALRARDGMVITLGESGEIHQPDKELRTLLNYALQAANRMDELVDRLLEKKE